MMKNIHVMMTVIGANQGLSDWQLNKIFKVDQNSLRYTHKISSFYFIEPCERCPVIDFVPFCNEALCDADVECLQDPENLNSLCISPTRTPTDSTTQFYGSCPSGFSEAPGKLCKDDNECELERGICGSPIYGKCENLFGSYDCKCRVPKNNPDRLIFNMRSKCQRISVRKYPKKTRWIKNPTQLYKNIGTSYVWYAAATSDYRKVDAILDKLQATGRLKEINAFGNIQTGTSPLHIAIYKNRVNLVKKMISYPEIDLNFQTVDGRTPLFIAAEMNHLELVNALLAQATRVNMATADMFDRNAVWIAASNGNREVLESLIFHAKVSGNLESMTKQLGGDNKVTALYRAVQKKRNKCVKILVSAGIELNADSLMTVSVKRLAEILGNERTFSLVQNAKSHYFDKFVGPVTPDPIMPEAPGQEPVGLKNNVEEQFRLASSASLTKFKSQYQKYLWDLNARDRVNGRTVLWIAAQKSKITLLRFLLAKRVDVDLADKNGITPLAKSIMVNNIRTATMLLSHGANPNLVDRSGRSPLILAAKSNRSELLTLLIERGANLNQVNRQHCSALWMAAQSGAVKTAEILLHYNLDIEGAGTQNLVTPLWIASQNGHLEIVKLLHEKGASVNVFSTNHRTPLHVAAYYGHKEVVEYLIRAGADIDFLDDWQESALNDAKKRGHWTIVDLLQRSY